MLIEERVMVCGDPQVELFTARSDGPADRTLLVIHGGPGWDHTYLRDPLVELGEDRRLVFADLRGCGRSSRGLPDDAYNPTAATKDLVSLLDTVGLERVDVLGFSYGGLLAQRFALTAPQRVRRVIIASSSIAAVPASQASRPEADSAWRRLLADPADETTRLHAIAGIPADVWRPESREELRRRVEAVRFSADWARPLIAGTLPSARPDDAQARLEALGLPIMLLQGRQDTTFPADLAERTAGEMTNARAVVIDQAGHMAHIDQPKAWLEAIVSFLD